MSTSHEFLAHHLTNSYILSDYAEIAYIVCKLTPPAGGELPTNGDSVDQTLLKLRSAEKQFRKASILAALDTEKQELFTFYKKVDIVKDQRTILSKFGHVCQLNSCTIARKSATRIFDLLKPDSNRIYQLFIHAISQNIQLQDSHLGKPVSIGTKTYLLPVQRSAQLSDLSEATERKLWYLYRILIQVLASGKVVLTLQASQSGPLIWLGESENPDVRPALKIANELLYLAPFGQLARYNGLWRGSTSDLGRARITNGTISEDISLSQQSWMLYVQTWLSKRSEGGAEFDAGQSWIKVEVPLHERNDTAGKPTVTELTWIQVLWPSRLTYAFTSVHQNRSLPVSTTTKFNPMGFAEDWYNDTAKRNSLVAAAIASKSKEETDQLEDDPRDNHDVTFEDQEPPHVFGPPAFPPSQLIYPTPPGGPAAHPTPGMSSMDGLAPTPSQSSQQLYIPSDPAPDLEMHDISSATNHVENSSAQDEDLFEGMPDDTFEMSESLKEQDWDFFEEDFSERPSATFDHDGRVEGVANIENGQETSISERNTADNETLPGTVPLQTLSEHDDIMIDGSGADKSLVSAQVLEGRDAVLFGQKAQEPRPGHDLSAQDDEFKSSLVKSNHLTRPESRRSGTHDTIQFEGATREHDQRYKNQGKYWFDPISVSKLNHGSNYGSLTSTKPTDSGSDISLSSSESDESVEDTIHGTSGDTKQRLWADYEPMNSAVEEATSFLDTTEAPNDNAAIFKAIAAARSEEPFMYDISRMTTVQDQFFHDDDEKMTAMVAQILVDQISQSTILREIRSFTVTPDDSWCHVELSLHLSETSNSIANALLSELTSAQHGSSAMAQADRLNSLPKPGIIAKRGDQRIQADSTILRFWDTLNLQPYHGTKDVTAFCLCPAGSEIISDCLTFLQRMSDTYTGCSFGSHVLGTASGLSSNGVLTWQGGTTEAKILCQQLGMKIAANTQGNGVVIIYILHPTADMFYCRELCHGFALLFEAIVKTSGKAPRGVEVVLQLIPISFVASADTLVIPSRERYMELAVELYNRIPGNFEGQIPAACAMAVILDKPPPKRVEFDLMANVVDPLSREGACLHLAYSYSADGRWLVAAWSDETGTKALTMSYAVKDKGFSGNLRADIFRDMWEVSLDIMDHEVGRWRLVVVKSGFYLLEEVNEWLQITNQANQDRRASTKTVLLSVNLNSTIRLRAKDLPARIQPTPLGGPQNTGTTPATTPQNNSTSPDHGVPATPTPGGLSQMNAATPPEHNFESNVDGESLLIDPNEESWSVILGFGMNQSSDASAIRSAGASGLLLKRVTEYEEQNRLAILEVHLVATSRTTPAAPTQKEREVLLQDMLGQFRRLATLAASRFCIDKDGECIPWHIATAVKGANVLGEVM